MNSNATATIRGRVYLNGYRQDRGVVRVEMVDGACLDADMTMAPNAERAISINPDGELCGPWSWTFAPDQGEIERIALRGIVIQRTA